MKHQFVLTTYTLFYRRQKKLCPSSVDQYYSHVMFLEICQESSIFLWTVHLDKRCVHNTTVW